MSEHSTGGLIGVMPKNHSTCLVTMQVIQVSGNHSSNRCYYFLSRYLATSIKDVANLACSQSEAESGELQ
jgi:hypothetical protein